MGLRTLSTGRSIIPSTQNLNLHSEAFDTAAYWVPTRIDVVANAAANPLDGTMTADQITDQVAAATTFRIMASVTICGLFPSAGGIVGRIETWSIYVKKVPGGTRNWIGMLPNNGQTQVYFDVGNGVLGTTVGAAFLARGMEPLGNGWYRCWVTCTVINGAAGNHALYIGEADNDVTYTGDGQGSFYLYGSQVSQTFGPISYVATSASVFNEGTPRSPIPKEQNLFLQSEDYTAGWTTHGLSHEVGTVETLDPWGGNAAVKVTETAVTSLHRFYRSVLGFGSQKAIWSSVTMSCFVKRVTSPPAAAEGQRYVALILDAPPGGTAPTVTFDLTDGSIIARSPNSTVDIVGAGSEDCGNGWYRIWLMADKQGALVNPQLYFLSTAILATAGGATYLGDITKSIYITGHQVNEGAVLLPYKKTTTIAHHHGTARSYVRQTQNLLPSSENFGHANWILTELTCDPDTLETLDPMGGNSADKVIETVANSAHRLFRVTGTAITPKAEYTYINFSVFAKRGTRQYMGFLTGVLGSPAITFDLLNGTITYQAPAPQALQNGKIEAVGNDWYRCSFGILVRGVVNSNAFNCQIHLAASGTVVGGAYVGEEKYIYLWGAQQSETEHVLPYRRNGDVAAAYLNNGAPRSLIA